MAPPRLARRVLHDNRRGTASSGPVEQVDKRGGRRADTDREYDVSRPDLNLTVGIPDHRPSYGDTHSLRGRNHLERLTTHRRDDLAKRDTGVGIIPGPMPPLVHITPSGIPVTVIDEHSKTRTVMGDRKVLLHSDGHERTSETKNSAWLRSR